jgi:hypothetical protein
MFMAVSSVPILHEYQDSSCIKWEMGYCGAILLFPLYAFMVWTETSVFPALKFYEE